MRDLGRIDIVVANAAIQRWKGIADMQDADWNDVIDNNVNGTANTVRAFCGTLLAQGSGRFILVSSMQGKHGTAGAASYSASKHAIIGLMKSAAEEFGKKGVTVNCILPGLVDTALTRYPARWSHVIGETQENPPRNPTEAETWNNRAARAASRRMATARGYLADGGVPGVGRVGDVFGCQFRGHRRRQRAGRLTL